MLEKTVKEVTDEEVMEAMNKLKLEKAAGPSEVNMDMIIAQWFSTGVPRNPRVPPMLAMGSVKLYSKPKVYFFIVTTLFKYNIIKRFFDVIIGMRTF